MTKTETEAQKIGDVEIDSYALEIIKDAQTILSRISIRSGQIKIICGEGDTYKDDKKFILDLKKRTDVYVNYYWRKNNGKRKRKSNS